MNYNFYGEVQRFYVAADGSLQYATGGIINDDWREIIVTLKGGDCVSLIRSAKFKPEKTGELFLAGQSYQFVVRFSVGMCNRSGQNMTILTASLEASKRMEY